MLGGNNIYISNDPILGQRDYNAPLAELERMEQTLSERMAQLRQFKAQAQVAERGTAQSGTPVWDEIDTIMQSMSDKEYELVANSEEWVESNNRILALIQATQLRMLRPVIEQSKEGKEALENHLSITKRLKKSATKEVEAEMSEFKEYKERYSDMPYDEYLKMKREPKSRKK